MIVWQCDGVVSDSVVLFSDSVGGGGEKACDTDEQSRVHSFSGIQVVNLEVTRVLTL